ncbi:MAG: glycosyltransferase family 9 protein, partial [Flavobacteriales bacterium]|nr:glycosyltransferase family 9 protein [Flavobacteriales bacterium]
WAEDQFASGKSTPLALVGLKVVAQWVKTFCIKRGFLDGHTGWTIARLSAWATWRKHARLRALHRQEAPTPHKILVARTDALGDLVLSLPILRALRNRFPKAQIDLLVRPYAEAVARASQDVDHVLVWTDKAAKSAHDHGPGLLKRAGYDAVVLAYPDAAVVAACVGAGIPMRLGTGRRWHTLRHMTHPNWDGRKDSGGHESWHGLRLLMPLGIEAPSSRFQDTLLEPPAADDAVEQALSNSDHAPVLLHPGSHGSAGNWAPERFAALARELVHSGMNVAFTGTAQEGRDFAPHFPDVDGVSSWFGRFSLHQLLAAQSRSKAVVASSTGPLHTATALGIPGVGLYGKSAPAWAARWAPIGPQVAVIETDSMDDQGHLDISVDQVKAAVLAFTLPTPSP